MLRYVFRLIFGLVSLAVMLGYQALPTAALVMQERRSQEPTLPSNLTQDVLQVASAISPSCANLDSCIDLVTTVIPKCDQLGRDPGCWCANHDALHNCAMCMISPTDNQTTADQTEAAAAGHSGFHAACDAYAEIVNGTSGSLASNDTLGPIDPEIWNTKNIRPDGTALIVHSSKDLASGQGKKVIITWSYGIIVIRIEYDQETGELWCSIGVKIPFQPYKPIATFRGKKCQSIIVPLNRFSVWGSVRFFCRNNELWVRLVVTSPWLNIVREFKIFSFGPL